MCVRGRDKAVARTEKIVWRGGGGGGGGDNEKKIVWGGGGQ